MVEELATQHVFVTGRLCLFGEHSDWAGEYRAEGRFDPAILPGRTLVIGTNEGLHARVNRLAEHVLVFQGITSAGNTHGPRRFPLDDEKALEQEAAAGGFWSYVAGTALCVMRELKKRGVRQSVQGLNIDNHNSTLPACKGLSSSAAVCVLVARAFSAAYNLQFDVRTEMELAYQGEVATPSQCGRMDQACAYGSTPVVLTFDGNDVTAEPLPLGGTVRLVFADLEASKDTVTILRGLRAAYPVATTDTHAKLHRFLGEQNTDIVSRASAALAKGDAAALGALMVEAQAAFDAAAMPLVPSQLEAPVLHRVLADERVRALSLGGKGVGSQGDGSVQFVCATAAQQQELCELLEREFHMSPYHLTMEVNTKAPAPEHVPSAAAV